MRIVLDTNVLIAAFVSRGQCHELLEYCALNHTLVSSNFILEEFKNKLQSKFKINKKDIAEAMTLLHSRLEVVEPLPLSKPICRDSDDDWILATTLTGRCDCLITGDKDLLSLQTYQGIPIIAPGGFWGFEADGFL